MQLQGHDHRPRHADHDHNLLEIATPHRDLVLDLLQANLLRAVWQSREQGLSNRSRLRTLCRLDR